MTKQISHIRKNNHHYCEALHMLNLCGTKIWMSTELHDYKLHRRFDRLWRLFGDGAIERLMNSTVFVFGLGGVGSFAAEALARSAIGNLVLIDCDLVCVTNINRQIQALSTTVGQSKAQALAQRLGHINPKLHVDVYHEFYDNESSDRLLRLSDTENQPDFVVDCIDNITAKAHLIARCNQLGIPIVSSMGASGKKDPTRVRIDDLAHTRVCPLAKDIRRILRKKYAYPSTGK